MTSSLLRKQKGASMVEMALVISIFLAVVFAIIEFSLAVFYASRLSEATRAGARYAIVNHALIEDIKDKTCEEIAGLDFQRCTDTACEKIVASMSKVVNVTASNVFVRYQCAETGYTGSAGYSNTNKEIYSITVAIASNFTGGKLIGIEYPLIIPKEILHLEKATITMPVFESTRLSEDLWSPVD